MKQCDGITFNMKGWIAKESDEGLIYPFIHVQQIEPVSAETSTGKDDEMKG